MKVLSNIFRHATKLRMIISRSRPEASYRYQLGHFFFFLPLSVECVSLYWVGRSVGLKKRKTEKRKTVKRKTEKKKKKIQEVFEYEAWYPSIIAVEPGNNKTRTQKNMAEALVDVIVILTL